MPPVRRFFMAHTMRIFSQSKPGDPYAYTPNGAGGGVAWMPHACVPAYTTRVLSAGLVLRQAHTTTHTIPLLQWDTWLDHIHTNIEIHYVISSRSLLSFHLLAFLSSSFPTFHFPHFSLSPPSIYFHLLFFPVVPIVLLNVHLIASLFIFALFHSCPIAQLRFLDATSHQSLRAMTIQNTTPTGRVNTPFAKYKSDYHIQGCSFFHM